MSYDNWICFDVETRPLPQDYLESILPPFDPSEVKTGNLKDPEKIAQKLAETEANHRNKFFENAALDPLTGRVLVIGLLDRNGPRYLYDEDEAKLLVDFWNECRGDQGRLKTLIGFNILEFDFPFLIRRSWRHRVRIPFDTENRWWRDQSVDLRNIWRLGDWHYHGSLDAISKFLGVGSKTGSGKDFAALWDTDRERAVEYLKNDLKLTHEVAKVLGVL